MSPWDKKHLFLSNCTVITVASARAGARCGDGCPPRRAYVGGVHGQEVGGAGGIVPAPASTRCCLAPTRVPRLLHVALRTCLARAYGWRGGTSLSVRRRGAGGETRALGANTRVCAGRGEGEGGGGMGGWHVGSGRVARMIDFEPCGDARVGSRTRGVGLCIGTQRPGRRARVRVRVCVRVCARARVGVGGRQRAGAHGARLSNTDSDTWHPPARGARAEPHSPGRGPATCAVPHVPRARHARCCVHGQGWAAGRAPPVHAVRVRGGHGTWPGFP